MPPSFTHACHPSHCTINAHIATLLQATLLQVMEFIVIDGGHYCQIRGTGVWSQHPGRKGRYMTRSSGDLTADALQRSTTSTAWRNLLATLSKDTTRKVIICKGNPASARALTTCTSSSRGIFWWSSIVWVLSLGKVGGHPERQGATGGVSE